MNLISDALGGLARLLTRLVLWAAGAVFALSLLVAALVVVVVLTLRALFTGRKPEPVVVWRRWQSAAKATRFGARGAGADAEVVDVQAREVGPHARRNVGQADAEVDAPARIEHQK